MTVSCGTIAMRSRMSAGSASKVDSVEHNAPRLRIIEALGELEDGRLSRARRSTTASRSRSFTTRLKSFSADVSRRVG